MSNFTTVITALIKKDNKFLIVKRKSSSKIHPDLWMFPGGKAEQGEDILTTLKREIKEEVNLEIKDFKKISEYEYKRPDNSITLGICFSAVSNTEEVILDRGELEDFKWITPEEFKDYKHLEELDLEVKKAFSKSSKSI